MTAGHPKPSLADYHIRLNLLSVTNPTPPFSVFRKLRDAPHDLRPFPDTMSFRLPRTSVDEQQWPSYWVSTTPKTGYEEYHAAMHTNVHLSCRVLHFALATAARQRLLPEQYHIPSNPFIAEVSFIQATHPEGNEQLEVQPYYLRSTRQFGYLVDFRFRLKPGRAFSRRVQQLSLALDGAFKRNLNYYVDRHTKMLTFINSRKDVFSAVTMPGSNAPLGLSFDFLPLPADRLRTKTYIFGNSNGSRSQFTGPKRVRSAETINASATFTVHFSRGRP